MILKASRLRRSRISSASFATAGLFHHCNNQKPCTLTTSQIMINAKMSVFLSCLMISMVLMGSCVDAEKILEASDVGTEPSTIVDLSAEGFTDIDKHAFDHFPNLEYLNLANNNLQMRDPSYLFWQLRNLKGLNLSGTDLWFGPKTFTAFGSLIILDISNNSRITALDDAHLFGLTNLSSVRIGGDHKIHKIKCNVFSGAAIWDPEPTAMENDSTGHSYNYLSSFLKDEYSVVGERHINLDWVGISQINTDKFEALPNMISLSLRWNDIENTNIVAHLPTGIRALYMAQNSITVIKSYSFSTLEQLDLLDLSSNAVSTIEPFAFRTNEKLRKLYLDDNEISHLDAETFAGLSALEGLWLSINKLKTISAGVFDLPALTRLDLSNNLITFIKRGALKSRGRFFLDISYNTITKLENGVFSGLTKNKNCTIKIAHTPIEFIEGGIFDKNV